MKSSATKIKGRTTRWYVLGCGMRQTARNSPDMVRGFALTKSYESLGYPSTIVLVSAPPHRWVGDAFVFSLWIARCGTSNPVQSIFSKTNLIDSEMLMILHKHIHTAYSNSAWPRALVTLLAAYELKSSNRRSPSPGHHLLAPVTSPLLIP